MLRPSANVSVAMITIVETGVRIRARAACFISVNNARGSTPARVDISASRSVTEAA